MNNEILNLCNKNISYVIFIENKNKEYRLIWQ